MVSLVTIVYGLVISIPRFGGILLHGDRFKHINNVARILLLESNVGCKVRWIPC